jgi:hypothetical protein
MTPLARAIAEASVANPKWWRESGNDKLLAPFPHDVKCFEVSQVYELAHELADQASDRGNVAESLAFLPAPVTWIEHRYTREDGTSALRAFLLVEKADKTASAVSIIGVDINGKSVFIPAPLGDLRLLDASDPDGFAIDSTIISEGIDPISHAIKAVSSLYKLRDGKAPAIDEIDPYHALETNQSHSWWLYAALSIINSPKIIAQSTHKPSAGLQKRLNRKASKPFGLLPWHEIFLDVQPPSDGESHGGGERLTGPKAFHFCRSFIRIRLGKLEHVRAHWRGDPARGISQASYRVVQ